MADMLSTHYETPFVRGFVKSLEELHETRQISEEPLEGECCVILRMNNGTQVEPITDAAKNKDGNWVITTVKPHEEAYVFVLKPEPETVKTVYCQSGCIFKYDVVTKKYEVAHDCIEAIRRDIEAGSNQYIFKGYIDGFEWIRGTSFLVSVWSENIDGQEVPPYHVVSVDGTRYDFDMYDETSFDFI